MKEGNQDGSEAARRCAADGGHEHLRAEARLRAARLHGTDGTKHTLVYEPRDSSDYTYHTAYLCGRLPGTWQELKDFAHVLDEHLTMRA